MASKIPLQCTLVASKKLEKLESTKYKEKQAALLKLWDQYDQNEISPGEFLRKASCVHHTVIR